MIHTFMKTTILCVPLMYVPVRSNRKYVYQLEQRDSAYVIENKLNFIPRIQSSNAMMHGLNNPGFAKYDSHLDLLE